MPDWFVTSKMLEKPDNVIFCYDDVELNDINSDIATFFSDGVDLNTMGLENINLNNDNLMKMTLKLLC